MNPTFKAMEIDYDQIATLNEWLESLWRQEAPADPLTLTNLHRRLAKLHAEAAVAALKCETESSVKSDAGSVDMS